MTHRVNLGRILPRLRDRTVESITAADVADLVADLHADGLARETIRKTRATLAMVLDFAGAQPNPKKWACRPLLLAENPAGGDDGSRCWPEDACTPRFGTMVAMSAAMLSPEPGGEMRSRSATDRR